MNLRKEKAMNEYYNVVLNKGGYIIEEYINNYTKIAIQCGTCSNIWKACPDSIKRGTWCPACAGCCPIKSRNDFYDTVEAKGGKVLGIYINNHTKVEIQCGKCNNSWCVTPSDVKSSNRWCPTCSKFSVKARDSFHELVESRGGQVLSNYINKFKKVDIQCGECNNIWSSSPSNIKGGTWCPACAGCCPIKSRNDFYEIVAKRGGIVIDEYINNTTKVNIQCGKCKNIWSTCPNHVKHGSWCHYCRQSKGEYVIMSWLKKYPDLIQYHTQYKIPDDNHPYDFLIFYNNMYYLVEYDGNQHFEYRPHFHKTEEGLYDRIKTDIYKNELAQYNNIPLLRISYLELDYVEQWLEYFLKNPCSIMYSNQELYTKTYALIQNATE